MSLKAYSETESVYYICTYSLCYRRSHTEGVLVQSLMTLSPTCNQTHVDSKSFSSNNSHTRRNSYTNMTKVLSQSSVQCVQWQVARYVDNVPCSSHATPPVGHLHTHVAIGPKTKPSTTVDCTVTISPDTQPTFLGPIKIQGQ